MPDAFASSAVEGMSLIDRHSQIAISFASAENRNAWDARQTLCSHNAKMTDGEEKNGGPNHLRAWMRFRDLKGQQLADRIGGGVTAGMISDLANSKRALSAKWLRRLAPALKTTPGHLLDHDPESLPTGIAEIWFNADEDQRAQIVKLANVVVPPREVTNG